MALSSSGSSEATGGVPSAEPRPIVLRAYAEPAIQTASRGGGWASRPSHYTLIFDCETTPDRDQPPALWRLPGPGRRASRRGRILLRSRRRRRGGADQPADKPPGGLEAGGPLRTSWRRCSTKLGYEPDATIVGFNLPFDISRLAIGHESARAVRRPDGSVDRSMQGGFTFKLSPLPGRPHVRVRHLNRHAAFINFAAPNDPGGRRAASRGFFVDVKTLAKALTGKSFRLRRSGADAGGAPKGQLFKDFAPKDRC